MTADKMPFRDGDNASRAAWAVKIDYVSMTSSEFHVSPQDSTIAHHHVDIEATIVWAWMCSQRDFNPDDMQWRPVSPRSGYTRSAQHPIGARYFAGHATAKPLLELGGAACDYLQGKGQLLPLIERNIDGVTRIDFAGDIVTDLTPADFLSFGRSPRHLSAGRAVSATGETEYIGAPTSDRRCRVYRYAPPHPRADALRVEAILRRELAKAAALELSSRSIEDVWSAACQPFSFKCPLWRQPAQSLSPRETLRNEPTNASRLRWLEKQIRPAVIEAHKAGLIDLREWLDAL